MPGWGWCLGRERAGGGLPTRTGAGWVVGKLSVWRGNRLGVEGGAEPSPLWTLQGLGCGEEG